MSGRIGHEMPITRARLTYSLTEANAAFVAAMEDVLDVYTRPHDPARPLVCLDETSKQLVAETRTPEPMRPGQPARHDDGYKRNGTANLSCCSRRWKAGVTSK